MVKILLSDHFPFDHCGCYNTFKTSIGEVRICGKWKNEIKKESQSTRVCSEG